LRETDSYKTGIDKKLFYLNSAITSETLNSQMNFNYIDEKFE